MKIMKCVKAAVLAGALVVGSAQALPLISPEVGGMVGTSFDNAKNMKFDDNTNFTYGAYGRLWLKPGSFRIAPFVKWENLTGFKQDNALGAILSGGDRNNNIQYGAVAGFEFFYLTPYIGAAYSQFTGSTISDTWALNYGLKFKIPILPLAIGIDASWQKPKLFNSVEMDMHRISLTFGLHF